MISHKYKCIFIHIPKCVGTSIEQALGHFDEYSGRDRQDHRTIRMIENPVPLTQLITSKETLFSIWKERSGSFTIKHQTEKTSYLLPDINIKATLSLRL